MSHDKKDFIIKECNGVCYSLLSYDKVKNTVN